MGDSHNINNGMRAADGSGDTLGLQGKAPSRGMRYLVNIINKFHVATRNITYSCAYTLKQGRAKKAPHAPTHGSIAHVSALGLVLLVYCSMLQQMDKEAEARATDSRRRSSEHDHMHGWYI